MKFRILAAAACAGALTLPASALAQFEQFQQFKGKVKPGMYEYKMDMDMGQMAGMPPGMGKQSRTTQNCVTQKDVDEGVMGTGDKKRMPENCQVKDFKMSGNTATYTTACKGNGGGKGPPMDMTADNRITFREGGYVMDMKMAMNQGGQPMTMTQHIESRYIGPCDK